MASELTAIDITHMPDVARLAEEVRATGRSRVLRRADEDVAVLVPVPAAKRRHTRRTPSTADYEAFLASAGGWKDEDTDTLIANIYESRRSSRPPIEL
jgi:hypothetical protein